MNFRSGVDILFVAALWCGLLCSCATSRPEPRVEFRRGTTLLVARAGDTVTLSFESAKGKTYTIYYTDQPETQSRWQPLPGHVNIVGTGKTLTFQDRLPASFDRRYKLDTVDVSD